jgi:NADPH2:quinone reductase
MRRVRFREYGGPEVLEIEEAERPEPGEGELLVEVCAAGVTLPVVRLTRGGDVPLPHAPGGEVAGRVVATGPGVAGWRAGQRVAGLAFTGAYAEFATLPATSAFAVPDGVGDAAALLLVRSGQVALGALRAAALRPGERVLVTAAAGGVGHLVVQLARALGAGHVTAAVSAAGGHDQSDGDEAGGRGRPRTGKDPFLRELGADEVVTYDDAERWGEADVVLDGAGGSRVRAACLRALAPLGRLVVYNGVGGSVDVGELRMHGRSVIGFAMRPFASRRRDLYEAHQRELWALHASGRLTTAVHRTLPLGRAAEAHRIIEARENLGKVVLVP